MEGEEIMGWGCYKHEMDAGSEMWVDAKDRVVAQGLKNGTFGRDDEICPLCYEEMSSELQRLKGIEQAAKGIDTAKLLLLAEWLDMKYPGEVSPSGEVQSDLRRWANNLNNALLPASLPPEGEGKK
jgi:hypothetical protein